MEVRRQKVNNRRERFQRKQALMFPLNCYFSWICHRFQQLYLKYGDRETKRQKVFFRYSTGQSECFQWSSPQPTVINTRLGLYTVNCPCKSGHKISRLLHRWDCGLCEHSLRPVAHLCNNLLSFHCDTNILRMSTAKV